MTFHRACNPGAVLQAYALQTCLAGLGHDAFFLDYVFPRIKARGIRNWIGRTPYRTLTKLQTLWVNHIYRSYRQRHLKIEPPAYFDYHDLELRPPAVDTLICGSDQVWNPLIVKNEKDQRAYLLDFGSQNVKRIAYAVSLGTDKLPEDCAVRLKESFEAFCAVGVREIGAVELLARLGIQGVTWVPDPTMLLEAGDYRDLEEAVGVPDEEYVFWYQLQGSPEKTSFCRMVVQMCARILGGSSFRANCTIPLMSTKHWRVHNPGQWLRALRKSSCVVTDSFHGVIFSILFGKPFVVIERWGESSDMNIRIQTLEQVFGFKERILTGREDEPTISDICRKVLRERTEYAEKLDQLRAIGKSFLSKALE